MKKNSKINSITSPLFKIGKAAISNKLLSTLFVGGAGGTAIATSAPISISFIAALFVAYAGINYFEGKDKAEKQKIITDEFDRRLDDIRNYFKKDRETQVAELSHILEVELQQKEVIDIVNYLKEKTDNQNIKFEDISQQVGFTQEMLSDFKTQLEPHLNLITKIVTNINETTIRTELKAKEYTEDIKNHTSESAKTIMEFLESKFGDLHQNNISCANTPASGGYDPQMAKQLEKIQTDNNSITDTHINHDISSGKASDNQIQSSSKVFSPRIIKKDKTSKNIFELFNKIQLQMTYRNYSELLGLSKELEIYEESFNVDDVKPYIQVLLARLAIHCCEVGINCNNKQIEKAKRLLELAEQNATVDLCNRIDVLKAIIMELEGTDITLNILKNKTNPYAIRARLASLLKNKKYGEAVKLIEGQKEVHEHWAEPALVVFLCAKEDEKAEKILEEIEFSSNHSLFIACSVKYAEILSLRLTQFEQRNDGVDCKLVSEKIREVLAPVLLESSRPDSIKGIYGIAYEMALQANMVLGNIEEIKKYSKLLISCSPIPLIVLECIMRQLIQAPPNLLRRIRKEHKTNINAHILSAAIQSQCFQEPEKAFFALKKAVCLTKTKEEKEATLNCLLELYQYLNKKSADQCYELAMGLCESDSLSALKLKAGKYLRNNQPDKVFELFKKCPENDPVILQMQGNAYWQKKTFFESANCFKKVAELVNSVEMYNKAGDLFLQENKLLLVIECYEKSISLYPDNITVLSNLAAIYTSSYIDLNKALEHLTALNNLQANDSNILVNIAICYARLFEPEKSLKYYDKACEIEKPIIEAVIGKAELLITMKRENDAFSHIELYKNKFKNNPKFTSVYMNTAHYAGHDDIAHQILMTIMESQKKGKTSEETVQTLDQNEFMQMFKERAKETNDTNKNIHIKMLKGQFPWIWAESINGNRNFYWGWLRRTQELKWLFEAPTDWANFTIYSTNGFHSQKDINQKIRLLPIKSPPADTTIVADISALITLHQLNLLDIVVANFNRIVVPEEYLETALNQGKEVLLHQKSTYIAAAQIKAFVDNGDISILSGDQEENIIKVDEYCNEPDETQYHIRDIVESLFTLGIIDENLYKEALKVCSKPQVLKNESILQYKQGIQIELTTLSTLVNLGILEQLCDIYNIYILSGSYNENTQIIRRVNLQNEAFDKHYQLWKHLKSYPQVEFIRVNREKDNDANIDIENALLGSKLARENNWSLLVDDRVLQALVFNESPDVLFPVFGTDALILCLQQAEKISKEESLNSLLKLMEWRYRFIVLPPELLVEAAVKYSKHPPGKILNQIAKYVQECMHDPGLFTGREKTEFGDSIALRLYLTWIKNISEFIALIWKEKQITKKTAEKITIWAIDELLPSAPKALHDSQKSNLENMIPRQVISNYLISVWIENNNEQTENTLRIIQECFGLDNEEYSMIILEILNDVVKTFPPDADKKTIETSHVMKERILTIAFSHIERIGIRTLIPLQQLNLSDMKATIGEDIDPKIIRNLNHKRRVPLLPGPLLIYCSDDQTKNSVVEVKYLFFSPLKKIRQAALECYENMIAPNLLSVSPKIKDVLKVKRNDILSKKDSIWKLAAIAIYDALNNDVSISIAGANQIMHTELEIKNLLNTYVPKILYPKMQALDFTELVVNIPEKEHGSIQQLLKVIVSNSESISDLCQTYYDKLGHLPLAPKFSLGQVIKRWCNKNKKSEIWEEVWSWANSTLGPIPQYHACTVFVLFPEFIPNKKLSELWEKIKTIICDSNVKNKDAALHEAWQLRKDLNHHLTFYIEADLPGYDGSHIANYVLWLTERISSLFGNNPEQISFYRKEWIANALDTSSRIWFTASPSENDSALRYMNHVISSPWALSLMCLMGDSLEKLKPFKLNEELKNDFNESFPYHLLMAFPFNVKKPEKPTYAFQLSLTNTIRKWKKNETEKLKKSYNHILNSNKKLQKNETFVEEFKKISEKIYVDQLLLALTLKHKALTDPAIEDLVSQVISDEDWRNKNLLSIHSDTLGFIVEALSLLQIKSSKEWGFHLPHYIAALCDKTEDHKTLNSLFCYMVQTCLASDNYSAIYKLLTSKNAWKYVKYAREYRLHLENMQNDNPFWVKGKLRSLMAVMQI